MSVDPKPMFDLTDGEAEANIQWKGTDVCLDFQCACMGNEYGYQGHFDGFFASALRCTRCGAVYEMPTRLRLDRVEKSYHDPQDIEDEAATDAINEAETAAAMALVPPDGSTPTGQSSSYDWDGQRHALLIDGEWVEMSRAEASAYLRVHPMPKLQFGPSREDPEPPISPLQER